LKYDINASSFIVLGHIIFETTAQIPEVEFGHDMKFSISSLVLTIDPYQPSSFAVGLDMGVSG
jgi:hypothetical protein